MMKAISTARLNNNEVPPPVDGRRHFSNVVSGGYSITRSPK